MKKLYYTDYHDWREARPTSRVGTQRVFTDYNRSYYVNPNADVSGTVEAWGQFTPADLDTTDENSTTVFSGNEEEANEAIVEKVISFIRMREKKPSDAKFHDERANMILGELWIKYTDEAHGYQNERSMFKRVNVLEGGIDDELLKRDQWF